MPSWIALLFPVSRGLSFSTEFGALHQCFRVQKNGTKADNVGEVQRQLKQLRFAQFLTAVSCRICFGGRCVTDM